MSRPNLLFVFADQWRFCDVSWAGNHHVHTPALQRFAQGGTVFTHCFANAAVCGPSRACLMTGRLPLRHRSIANDLPLPPGTPTLGTHLQNSGYRTGYIGKWHLDGVPRSRWTPPGARRFGFENWAAFNCAHDYFNGYYYLDTAEPVVLSGYEPERQTDLALQFMDSAAEEADTAEAAGTPWALCLSWGPPHDPYPQVPQRFRDRYSSAPPRLRGNVLPLCTASQDPAAAAGPEAVLRDYYAACTALDEQFGRLLDGLRARGLEENTIVVFTSDHGDMLHSHGYIKKELPYDEATRVPFAVSWPGHVPTARCETLLSIVDMTPTLLGLLGLPGVDAMDFDGRDLSRAALGQEHDAPTSVLLGEWVPTDEAVKQNIPAWRAVRTGRHTYARQVDAGGSRPWLLFDNEADPLQRHNLVADAGLREPLEAELETWLRRSGDGLLAPDDLLRELRLVGPWNAREAELNGVAGHFL